MEVYNNLSELPTFDRSAITIGSFDGVHRGHQKIFDQLKLLAKESGGKSIVITFHPHPRIVLQPENHNIELITSIDEKVTLLESFGIDVVVVVPFNRSFLNQTPDEYIQEFLIQRFSPAHIVIGYDHKFGKNRAGDVNFLKKYQIAGGFKVSEIEKQEIENITISSSKIRKALSEGDIETTNHLLGHSFSINGTVVKGEGIGHTLGYPTANIESPSNYKLIPKAGIYAVKVLYQKKTYNSVLYIGQRPTMENLTNTTIEAHLFDFNKDIYGDKVKIEFVSYIRTDAKFDNFDDLRKQMDIDAAEARRILSQKQIPKPEKKKIVESPEVAIAILNFNGKKWFKKFLPSVLASNYPNQRIIIIDNASTDDSISFIKQHYPQIELIELSENYGFAKGYNEGLKQIDSPYLVLLNSDVEVESNWLNPIIDTMQVDLTIGVCQPKVKWEQNKEYFEYSGAAGGMMDAWGYPFCKGRILDTLEKDEGQYDQNEEIFWASGAAFVIRNQLFKNLEGFDEDYFAHHEEIDLCWRIKKAGFKIMAQNDSTIYHYGGGTLDYQSPRKVFYNFRNSLFNLIKNENFNKLYWLIPLRLVLDGLAGILFLSRGKISSIASILKAHFSFYRNLGKFLKKRKHYQELIQKVSINQQENMKGRFNKSILIQYYLKGRKKYNQLP